MQSAQDLSAVWPSQGLRVRLFGPFEVRDGASLQSAPRDAKQQALLARLLTGGRPLSRAEVWNWLWPEATPDRATASLRKAIHHMRRALPWCGRILNFDGPLLSVRLDAEVKVDALVIEEALRASDLTPGMLAAALELYRSDFLPGADDDWTLGERRRWERLCTSGIRRLCGLLADQGEYQEAARWAERLIAVDTTDGQQHVGLIQYLTLSRGAETSDETYRNLKAALDNGLHHGTGEAVTPILAGRSRGRADPALRTLPLVGRAREMAALGDVWCDVQSGATRVVVLEGDAGVGKSRLAEEFADGIRHADNDVLRAACHDIERPIAYAPLIRLLRQCDLTNLSPIWATELSRILPELAERLEMRPARPVRDGWSAHRFHYAIAKGLAAERARLVLIEDIHWADRQTTRWLDALIQGLYPALGMLICTVRPNEDTWLRQSDAFLKAVADGRVVRLPLGPLDQTQIMTLARAALGETLSPILAQRFWRECEGNPLLLVETLRAEDAQDHADMPGAEKPAQATTFSRRISLLAPRELHLAELAAALGRTFEVEVLVESSGRSAHRVLLDIDRLCALSILRSRGPNQCEFSHDRLREATYAAMSESRKRVCHHQVATALAARVEKQPAIAIEVAEHWVRAGLSTRAAPFYRMATEYAIRSGDLAQAATYLERLEQFLHATAKHEAAFERVDLLLDMGSGEAARKLSGEVLTVALAARDAANEARARLKLARCHYAQADFPSALREAEASLTIFERAADGQGQMKALMAIAEILTDSGNMRRGAATLRRLLRLAQASGDPEMEAEALNSLALLEDSRGRATQAERHYRRALDLLDEGASHEGVVTIRGNLAVLYTDRGRLDLALWYLNDNVRRCRAWGLKAKELVALGNLSAVLADLERYEAAARCAAASLQASLRSGDLSNAVWSMHRLAAAAHRMGQAAMAQWLWTTGIETARRTSQSSLLCRLLEGLAEMQEEIGDHVAACALAAEAIQVARHVGRRTIEFKASVLHAVSSRNAGQISAEAALEALEGLGRQFTSVQERALIAAASWQVAGGEDLRRKALEQLRLAWEEAPRAVYAQAYRLLGGDPPLARKYDMPRSLDAVPLKMPDYADLREEIEAAVSAIPSM